MESFVNELGWSSIEDHMVHRSRVQGDSPGPANKSRHLGPSVGIGEFSYAYWT